MISLLKQLLYQNPGLNKAIEEAQRIGIIPKWVSELLPYAFWFGALMALVWVFRKRSKDWIDSKEKQELERIQSVERQELARIKANVDVEKYKAESTDKMLAIESFQKAYVKRLEILEDALQTKLITQLEFKEMMEEVRKDYQKIQEMVMEFLQFQALNSRSIPPTQQN